MIEQLLKEMNISKTINHRNTLKYLEWFRKYKRIRIGKKKAAGVEILS